MENNLNLSSESMTKNNLTDEKINIKNVINEEDIKLNSINVTTPVRNVSVNEDIPSFREWTKKQLEEAEKQPGIK